MCNNTKTSDIPTKKLRISPYKKYNYKKTRFKNYDIVL